MTMLAERRRDATLHEIDRHRMDFLRSDCGRAVDAAEEAEFKVIAPDCPHRRSLPPTASHMIRTCVRVYQERVAHDQIHQIMANRANALKSTGPKTSAGKARASQNALRHGCESLALWAGRVCGGNRGAGAHDGRQ